MICFNEQMQSFFLHSRSSTYVMKVIENGQLLHLYWGDRIPECDLSYIHLFYNRSFSPVLYDASELCYSLDTLSAEYPAFGYGDYHTPAFTIQAPNGSRICDLRYTGHMITPGKPDIQGLPHLRADENEADTLALFLRDDLLDLEVTLFYTVFKDLDVISRYAVIKNRSSQELSLLQAASCCLEFDHSDFQLIDLHGSHCRERQAERTPLHHGIHSIESRRGASSHQLSPFAAFARPDTGEQHGEVYGISLIYSGNFRISAEVDQFDRLRVQAGINPFNFRWTLGSGDSFTTPEAIMVRSTAGLNGMSQNFHALYRQHLSPSRYTKAPRPIVINSWEASYFDFDEEKLKALIASCEGLGIDTFVLDDGWFGHRDNDTSSLGDWAVNTKKLPHGLSGIIETCKRHHMEFGLWFEPEMVSPDSDLYRRHPDWCIHAPGRIPSQSRNQLVLDLSRQEVQDFMAEAVSSILREYDIRYVKWDMNRNITDLGSEGLPADRQAELSHRYILGLYAVLERLTTAFPHVLFEGCSGGGGRFDFGMLYYMPQTWTSDNSDAVDRLKIQYGTSYLFPPAAMAAHVSACPNHQTGRMTPFETRGNVALGFCFGYELNPLHLSPEETEAIKRQTARYKEFEPLMLEGRFYRLCSPFQGNECCWQQVSSDGSLSIVLYARVLATCNPPVPRIQLAGLLPNALYRIDELDLILPGEVLMNVGFSIPWLWGDFSTMLFTLRKYEGLPEKQTQKE